MTELAAVHLTETTVWACRRGRTRSVPAGVHVEDGVFTVGRSDGPPDRFEPAPIRFVDDPVLLLESTAVPVADVLAALLDRAVTAVGGVIPLDVLVLTVPTGWGTRRRGTLTAAGRTVARDVRLVDLADAVVWAVDGPAASATGDAAAVVVDVAALSFSATSTSGTIGSGEDRVVSVELGSMDLAEQGFAARQFVDTLYSWRSQTPAWVALVGDPVGDRVVAEFRRRWGGGLKVLEPTGVEIVEATCRWGTSAGTESDVRFPNRQLMRRVIATVAAVTGLAGVGIAVWNWSTPVREPAVSAASVEFTPARLASGLAEVTIPPGWRERSTSGGADRVEMVRQDGRAARILLVHKELNEGADIEAVASTLATRIAERADTFGALRRVEVDARPALRYEERPDPDSLVRWLVVVGAGQQVSIGCQAIETDMADVDAACGEVVRSLNVAAP